MRLLPFVSRPVCDVVTWSVENFYRFLDAMLCPTLSRAAQVPSLSEMEQKRYCVKMIVSGQSALSVLAVFPWK